LKNWLRLLTPDVQYELPVRVTREKSAGPGFSTEAFHLKEDYGSLQTRIRRLESEYAWAEDPPSRTRHFVTNIRVAPGARRDDVNVRSNLLLFRSRGDSPTYEFLCGERRDTLRWVEGELRLASRQVLLAQTTLAIQNLAILL
jgi:3-phenylpropionate/cinnamic acid dioxygenase small subunit